jgi:hypothetical protein
LVGVPLRRERIMTEPYEQDWAPTPPNIAHHLIERHAKDWKEVGDLMERWARAWVVANPFIKPELDDE